MAKIPTPAEATLINDLPTLDGSETNPNILVTTDQGLRKVDWHYFANLNNYLIGQILAIPYGVYLEKGFIPLLGGVLKPEWFKDGLKVLKKRCARWVDDDTGFINLPNLQDIVLQMDYRLFAMQEEQDAIQNISGEFYGTNAGGSNGPFVRGGDVGLAKNAGTNNPLTATHWTFNTQKDEKLRTGERTREHTRAVVWCVYAGELIDGVYEEIFYMWADFRQSVLPVGDNSAFWPFFKLYKPATEPEGIGFNAETLKRVELPPI